MVPIANSEAAIFSRLVNAEHVHFTLDAARSLLSLEFSATDKHRIHELAIKAQSGALTPDEDAELGNFRQGNFLGVTHSKARITLCETGS